MLPKWFNKWNRDNPADIYGPAVLIGVVGGAVFVAAMLVSWGQPYATASMQTGPRGTGMSVPEFKADLARPDPTIAGFTTSDPIPPAAGAPLAKDAVPGVEPLLGELTVDNHDRLLAAMRTWTGIPDLLKDPEHYQSKVARRMIEMTRAINEDWSGHVSANKEVGVTCYTCHRGQPVPSGIWFQTAPLSKTMAGWSANQNQATMISQFTSLPSDALESYLVGEQSIKVHDLESRVKGIPGKDDYPGIQNAERTYALMNYFANSLGVGCVFCHNTRAFYDGSQVTPQWATATLGITMVQELNNEYLIPLQSELPPERMGVLHGDGPKLACNTCHKGYQQPLQGLDVIGNWPELATTGTPEYK